MKKVPSPKAAEIEDPEPTYIELTSKKVNGFDSTPLFNRSSPVEPAFREEQPVRTDPEIDKDENSLIDVEDVRNDSPPLPLTSKNDVEPGEITNKNTTESTRVAENEGVRENFKVVEVIETKTEVKEKKYNPLDVANLTSKDPPKSRSPPRKKLLTGNDSVSTFGRYPRPWRPDSGLYYGGEEIDYSVPITTAYLKHMRSMAYQERVVLDDKVSKVSFD